MTARVFRRTADAAPPVAVRAEGSTIWDADGKAYLDAAGGAIVVGIGHGRASVAQVMAVIEGREPAGKHASYDGNVMCFFEVGDGKGTLLRFDYEHPPKPPKPNVFWHLGKIVFNKTYFHTVPKGRV